MGVVLFTCVTQVLLYRLYYGITTILAFKYMFCVSRVTYSVNNNLVSYEFSNKITTSFAI